MSSDSNFRHYFIVRPINTNYCMCYLRTEKNINIKNMNDEATYLLVE